MEKRKIILPKNDLDVLVYVKNRLSYSVRKGFLKFEKKHIPKTLLRKLYITMKLSIKQIAFILSFNVATVHRKLHRYNIKARPVGKKRINITRPKLLFLKEKGFSVKEIAQHFNCNQYTIRRKMDEYGISYRIKGKSITHYNKKNFSRNLFEAAYLIGFGLGDLTIKKEGHLIHMKLSTTRIEQMKLFKKLFSKYTFVRTSKKDKQGARRLDCYLNDTFDFLLVKKDYIPSWICSNNNYLVAFAAGYIDAEGSFGINQRRARFQIGSYDKNILHQIHRWLIDEKINSRLRLISKKGELRPAGYHFNNDLWRLNVNEAQSLIKFINIIKPFISHTKRIKDINIVLDNIKLRERNGTI